MNLQCDGFMLVALEGVDPDCKVDWGQEEARGMAAGNFCVVICLFPVR